MPLATQQIEEAGVQSGDSACALPPFSLSSAVESELRRQTRLLARRLGVVGLMNVQYAIQGDRIYVLEVNPRASRTVPFVAKATSVPVAKIAVRTWWARCCHLPRGSVNRKSTYFTSLSLINFMTSLAVVMGLHSPLFS
jgi:carbamoylphosphate synthase large subunit